MRYSFPFLGRWVAGTGARGLERRMEPDQQHQELSPSVPACVGEPAPSALPLTYWVPGNPISDPGQPSNYIVFPPLQLGGSCGLRFTGKGNFKTKKEELDDIGITETAYGAGYYRSAREWLRVPVETGWFIMFYWSVGRAGKWGEWEEAEWSCGGVTAEVWDE